jgi:hypothetical protein
MELEVDGWIQQLIECKQLSEADVKKLCDKVRRTILYIVDNGPPLFPSGSVLIASCTCPHGLHRHERF